MPRFTEPRAWEEIELRFMSKRFFILIFAFLTSLASAEESSQLIMLPAIQYDEDRGTLFGGFGAWTNFMGSSWTLDGLGQMSPLYGQSYIDLDLRNPHLFDLLYFDLQFHHSKSTRRQFFGFGNQTSTSQVMQYSLDEALYSLKLGIYVAPQIVVGLGYSKRATGIGRGSDPATLQYHDVFTNHPWRNGLTTSSYQLFGFYDTRTSYYDPQEGEYLRGTIEKSQPQTGGELSYLKILLEAEKVWSLTDKSFLIATRALYEKIWGENVPFYLSAQLGGVDSLRAFRSSRFVDSGRVLFNIEPRYTVWTPGGLVQRVDLIVGLDVGRVFEIENLPPFQDYHSGWNVGLAGLLSGGIPVRIDYGIGPEEKAFYLHLFYPF